MNLALELSPPRDWQAFEDFCRDLFAAEWGDPETQKHGRPGQAQSGVDIFGRRRGRWQAVQCKHRRIFPETRLTKKEVRADVKAAVRFAHSLETLVIATTAPRDAHLQALAIQLTEEHGSDGPRVVVYGWSELCERLQNHPQVFGIWKRRLLTFLAPKPWNVPHLRNPYFTGRESMLNILHQALADEDTAALGQAISGLGGIGKTQTAVEYAYRHRDHYEAVLWTRAETEGELVAGYVEIARELDLDEKNSKELDVTVAAVKRWLEAHEGWLLVLDNADSPEKVEPFLPKNGRGRVLITSRAPVFDVLGIRKPLRLSELSRDDALSFLLERTERQGASDKELSAVRKIGEELGYLPLALEQAGAFITTRQSRFTDYLKSYRRRRLEVLEKAKPRAAQYTASVATTWSLNFEQVKAISRAAAKILKLSAFLASERIPEELLIDGALELGSILSQALASASDDPLFLDELFEPLQRYSLIERDPNARTYDVHRLVQEVIKATLGKNETRLWVERSVKALRRVYPKAEFSNWTVCERLQPHAQTVAKLIADSSLSFEAAGALMHQAGLYAHARARFSDAEPLYKTSAEITLLVFGFDHLRLAKIHNNLANLYRDRGDYKKAESLYRKSLPATKRVLGSKHPEYATSLNDLATLYYHQGRYKEARPLFEQALAIREDALEPQDSDIATTLSDLAVLYRTQGRGVEAEPMLQRALMIWIQAFGRSHPDVATGIHNLATLYHQQGRYTEAESRYQQALTVREKVLGTNHPDVAGTLHNFANFYRARALYEKAEQLYRRAIEIWEKVLGSDHPSLASSLGDLAGNYLFQRRFSEAEVLYQRSVEIRQKALGKDHADYANSLSDLANLYRSQGRYQEAESLFRQALEIQGNALGQDHSYLARTLHNLAGLLVALDRLDEAEAMLRRSVGIVEKELGEDHPSMGSMLAVLAGIYSDQGRFAEAEWLHRRSLAIFEQTLGADHPELATELVNFSVLLRKAGRDEEAAMLEAQAESIQAKRTMGYETGGPAPDD